MAWRFPPSESVGVTELEQHRVLFRSGEPIDHVYFIESGLVLLLAVTDDDRAIETGLVGSGGVVGESVILGSPYAATQAIVGAAGFARRMPISQFLDLAEHSARFRDDMLRNLNSQLLHAHQSALCHAFHSIEERFCRLLLQAIDAGRADVLDLTQEFCAHVLGVQRTSVSVNAHELQRAGIISTKRGKIHVIDKANLEERACDCYARLKLYSSPTEPNRFEQKSEKPHWE